MASGADAQDEAKSSSDCCDPRYQYQLVLNGEVLDLPRDGLRVSAT